MKNSNRKLFVHHDPETTAPVWGTCNCIHRDEIWQGRCVAKEGKIGTKIEGLTDNISYLEMWFQGWDSGDLKTAITCVHTIPFAALQAGSVRFDLPLYGDNLDKYVNFPTRVTVKVDHDGFFCVDSNRNFGSDSHEGVPYLVKLVGINHT